MEYEFEMDFYSDWISHLRNFLNQFGYIPATEEKDVSLQYFNLVRRLVRPIPRKILIAKEFKCPASLQLGLEIVKEKIEKGIDLRPHLSRRISDLNYDDDLLNDWDIYHLHLSTALDTDGFMKRTGPVLFVRFDEDNAYFINVLGHGNWTNQEMIRIIHRNWPKSIERFRIQGLVGLEKPVTDEDIKSFRSAHVNSFIEPEPGVIYGPPGMGLTTGGIGFEVVRASEVYAMIMRDYETIIKENIDEIEKKAKDEGRELGKRLSFILKVEETNVFAYEENHSIRVDLGEIP
ncbi:hypothetical protein [Bacillus sp. FJAT-29937]|uniref:hypothetical protein n=1 Tax=Bacillus sp. FJAT-29937 TaxID=1720553 RepID=UPI000AFEFB8F|nr:hypothetical protein [Bacillus sp. FJAT-29937]